MRYVQFRCNISGRNLTLFRHWNAVRQSHKPPSVHGSNPFPKTPSWTCYPNFVNPKSWGERFGVFQPHFPPSRHHELWGDIGLAQWKCCNLLRAIGPNNCDFRVHKAALPLVLPMFRDMFDTPQPPSANSDHIDIVDMMDPHRH